MRIENHESLPEVCSKITILDVYVSPKKQVFSALDPREWGIFNNEVLEKPAFNLGVFNHQDGYTSKMFKHPDRSPNKNVYPATPQAAEAGKKCLVGPPGYIYSIDYHLEETLLDHNALSVGLMERLWQQRYCTDAELPMPLVLCMFFHDIGKKWCARTNASGGISTFGHAECSAFVSNRWLKNGTYGLIDDWTRRSIVAAVYCHDLIKRWSPEAEFKLKVFHQFIGGTSGDEIVIDQEMVDDTGMLYPGLFRSGDNRMIKEYAERIASADAGVTEIVRDQDGKIVKYIVSCEPFSKEDGGIDVKAGRHEMTSEEYKNYIARGKKLFAGVCDKIAAAKAEAEKNNR